MPSDPSDQTALRQRLSAEIAQALRTCDEIGDKLTACHLQLALDRCTDTAGVTVVRRNGHHF